MLAIATVLVVLAIWLFLRRPRRPPNFPPGPPLNFLVGNLKHMNPNQDKFRERMTELRTKCSGDIVGLIDPQGRPYVTIFSYELIKEACHKMECSGRPPLFPIIYRCYMKNQGLVFSDGELWKEHRRFALHHMKNLGFGKKSMEETIMFEYSQLKDRLLLSNQSPFFVRKLFNTVVINVIWSLVAGRRFEMDDLNADHLFDLIDNFIKVVGPESRLLVAPWIRHIVPEWSGFNKLKRYRDETAKMFQEVVKEHRQTLDRDNPRDFVDLFLIEMEKPNADRLGYTDDNLCVIGMDFFLAGSETTSTALEWAMLYTAKHPHVSQAVAKEIAEVTGGNRAVELQDRPNMPYTEATLMEVQRMASSVAQTGPHYTSTSNTKLGTYDIPKGTTIFIHLEWLHQNPELWSEPGVFRPERFLDGKTLKKSPYLLPFGAGKRSCLGESVARMELFLFYANIIQDFSLVFPEGTNPPMDRIGTIIVHPKPYEMKFLPRNIH